jgi:hypothetical protein
MIAEPGLNQAQKEQFALEEVLHEQLSKQVLKMEIQKRC